MYKSLFTRRVSMQRYMLLAGICISLLVSFVACSNDNDEDDEPLVIEADSPREDVKTETDVFNDVMYYLDDYYFPTKVMGDANDIWLGYDVKEEEIELVGDYYLWELEREEDSLIPSAIDFTIQSEADETIIKSDGIGRRLAIDNLDGYLKDNDDYLYYSGENTDTADLFSYGMHGVDEADLSDVIMETGWKNYLSKEYIEGYSFLSELMNIPLVDLQFLDIGETNFDIKHISINYMKGNDGTDDVPLHQSVHITYQYKNYLIYLTIHNGNISTDRPLKWKDEDRTWEYNLSGKQKMQDKPDRTMKKEELEEVKEFITQKLENE